MDLVQAQIEMETLFSKNQETKRIRYEYETSDIKFAEAFHEIGLNRDFGFDLLIQMCLHKQPTLPMLVGSLRRHFGGDIQATTDALLLAAEKNVVDWNPLTERFVIKWDISPEAQNEIDAYQFPLPMIVEPKELKTNRDTGYLTGSGSVILKNNHHNDDVCLDYLNQVNKVALKLNSDVVAFVKNKWRNLDKPKEGETTEEYRKRVQAFNKYDRTSRDVLAHLEIAGNEFYLTHKYDKRGRVYCQGYHVTYQGTDWNKAVIAFAEGEIIDD